MIPQRLVLTFLLWIVGNGFAVAQSGVKPNLFIVSVGVSTYRDAHLNLKYAHKDALDLADAWRSQTDLYDVREVKTLINEHATRANVRAALSGLRGKVSPSSFLVFIFSGHGLNDALVTYEFDNDDRTATTLSRTDLTQQLTALGGNFIALIDACHSGSFAKSFGGGKDISADFSAEQDAAISSMLRALNATDKVNMVIGSSSSSEKSDECEPCQNGYFTQCLLDVFDGKPAVDGNRSTLPDADGNGFVETNELDNYIKEAVFVATRANSIRQNVISLQPNGYKFPIIRPRNSVVKLPPSPISVIAPTPRNRESIEKLPVTDVSTADSNSDTDSDGVLNKYDLCPNQKGEKTLGGCPFTATFDASWRSGRNGSIPLDAFKATFKWVPDTTNKITGEKVLHNYIARVHDGIAFQYGELRANEKEAIVYLESKGEENRSKVYQLLTGSYKWQRIKKMGDLPEGAFAVNSTKGDTSTMQYLISALCEDGSEHIGLYIPAEKRAYIYCGEKEVYPSSFKVLIGKK